MLDQRAKLAIEREAERVDLFIEIDSVLELPALSFLEYAESWQTDTTSVRTKPRSA